MVVGFGGAGGCSAIAAHDAGARVILIEKQPEATHHSNTRMSGGGYHSPSPEGDFQALKTYAKAMFSGENLPLSLEGDQADFSDELAEIWARYAPQNEAFMRSLDSQYRAISVANVAFPDFPGAATSGYAVVTSTYTGVSDEKTLFSDTRNAVKGEKQGGEAFHACLTNGLQSRGVSIHYGTRARRLILDGNGFVVGVEAERTGTLITYPARRAVILTPGGYEYNRRMRKAFLDGPGADGWAFYGTTENTGDGIEMALKAGAALSKIGSIAGRVICAIPERRHGLRIGLNTSGVGKPNEIVVDNYGRRYASEWQITKDPSRYIFYKEALLFDPIRLEYPRIPSWMVFDATLMEAGPVVRPASARYNAVEWGENNRAALAKNWILSGSTLAELAHKIAGHPDNRARMTPEVLGVTVARFNASCADGHDPDFMRDRETLGPVATPPFFAIPLYPGGPNTKGGLKVNAQRQVLDWHGRPIPHLYAVGEIASVFQFMYQAGGNLGECIAFGRIAGASAAAERPSEVRPPGHGGRAGA